MKLLSLFNQFEALADQQIADKATSRREAFATLGRSLGKAAVVALPTAAFLNPSRGFAQTTATSAVDVLNFALTLEYLEAEYYVTGLDSGNLLSGDIRETVALISKHETQHVEFLKKAIQGAGGTAVDKPEFDFTAGGTFADVFTNQATFLAVAQAFEDTGVRAYKGQAGNLSGDVLTAALQIHSVEARHAAMIRRMRGLKGWIVEDTNGTGAPAADAVYAGEDNIMHLGLDATSVTTVSRSQVTQAYDEPLTKQEVLDIAGLFIK